MVRSRSRSLVRGGTTYGRTIRIPRGLPSRMMIKMNRTFQFPSDVASGGTPDQIPTFTGYTNATRGRIWTSSFTPNDISDLNPSLSGGKRPIQFSEWAALYNRFYVKDWTCTIKLHNHAAPDTETAEEQNTTVLISVFSNSSSAPLSNTKNYRWNEEQDLMKGTRKLRFRLVRTKPSFRAGMNPVQTMVVSDSSKRLSRLEGTTFEDMVGLLGDTPTSPTKKLYHHIMVRQPFTDASATSTAIRMEVAYSFNVLLMDPKTLNPTLE